MDIFQGILIIILATYFEGKPVISFTYILKVFSILTYEIGIML